MFESINYVFFDKLERLKTPSGELNMGQSSISQLFNCRISKYNMYD